MAWKSWRAPRFVRDETDGPIRAERPNFDKNEPDRVRACRRIMDAASRSICRSEMCGCELGANATCWQPRGSLAACTWIDQTYGLPEIDGSLADDCIAEVDAETCGFETMLGHCNDDSRPERFACGSACDKTRVLELCAKAGTDCVLAGTANCG